MRCWICWGKERFCVYVRTRARGMSVIPTLSTGDACLLRLDEEGVGEVSVLPTGVAKAGRRGRDSNYPRPGTVVATNTFPARCISQMKSRQKLTR
jgi:hypothetical protein